MKGSSRRRRHDKEIAMEARVAAFEKRLDRKIAARHFDRDPDALKAERRIQRPLERQQREEEEEEEMLEAEERLEQRKDDEAIKRRDILELRLAKERARSEARSDAIYNWFTVAAIIALVWWLAG
jgi:hypothetical protein